MIKRLKKMTFLSHWNRFCHHKWDSDDEFGSKKVIKQRFESDSKQILGLSPFIYLFIYFGAKHEENETDDFKE